MLRHEEEGFSPFVITAHSNETQQRVHTSNKNLVCVEPGFTGRTQDNDMFNNSVLHEEMKLPDFPLKEGGYILVDEGFACNGRVIRPTRRSEMN